MLGTETLPPIEPGHAAEPGKQVGEADAGQAEFNDVPLERRGLGKVQFQAERTGVATGGGFHRPAVEPAVQAGQGAFQSAGLRMDPVLAPQDEVAPVLQGRELDAGAVPEPHGIGGELVGIQTLEGGEMGAEGTARCSRGNWSHAWEYG